MKYLFGIVAFVFSGLLSFQVWAQRVQRAYQNPGFFIPAKEMNRPAERLPQLSSPQKKSVARPARYIAVDGRFIPVVEKAPEIEMDLLEEEEDDEDFSQTGQNTESSLETENDVENDREETTVPADLPQNPKPVFEIYDDQTDTTKLPPYKTRYNKYFAKLNVFQQNGSFPPDADFDQAMEKFKTRKKIILYNGVPE